ncbi:MAG: rhomboid family intramembrane serine protease [Candidatus Woesearchaeota archaeon]|jgi:hypothetical protein
MVKEYNPDEFGGKVEIKNTFYKGYALYIVGFTAICFILQWILGNSFTELFMLDRSQFYTHPWMLVTAMFMHSGFWHIFFNMFGLLMFGPLIEQKIGTAKFLFVYFVGGIFANLIGMYFYPRALGASGAIMAMLGTLIVLMPTLLILIYGIIPMPLWAAGILWFILDFVGAFNPASSVGNVAHIAGMIFGLLFGLYIRQSYKRFYGKIKGKKHLSSEEVDDLGRKHL